MNVVHYQNPEYFYLLLLVPVFVLIFLIARLTRRRAMERFGQQQLISKLTPWLSWRRPWIHFFLTLLAFSLMVVAAVNPQVGSKLEEVKQEGTEIMIVLDVSQSMMAEDVRPNRLERSKMAVSRLIDNLPQDKVGIVLFAGNAITQVPLTTDHSAVKMMLRTVNTTSVPVQGTSLNAALHRAMASFQQEDLNNKIVILISDGENHQDDPLEAARLASQRGLTIHTVGIGTREGAPIPVYQNNRMTGFLKDQQGNTVVSRYDEQTLQDIATLTGGTFQHGSGADMGLKEIQEEVLRTERAEFDNMVFADYESRFHYFVALALIVLLFEIFLFERKNKWLDKIKLFG
ncbi:MAG: VWA domain-containing protein [Bacteroidales bacterium]